MFPNRGAGCAVEGARALGRLPPWGATNLQLYLGVGAEMEFHVHSGDRSGADFFIGARAPFGFSLMFAAPFDVFAELVANAWFAQAQRLYVDAALGGRFWF